jgi:hypothetical protein
MASPHTYGFSVANATIHRTGVLHRLAGVGGPAFAAGHLPRRLPSAPPDAARRAALVVLWFLVSFALACLRIARVLRVLGRSGCCSRAHTACC